MLICSHVILMSCIQQTHVCQKCGEQRNLVYCWQECKLVQPLRKTIWKFLKKLKIKLPYCPAILCLGLYLKKTKLVSQRKIYILMFIAALFIIAKAQTWKQGNYLQMNGLRKPGVCKQNTCARTHEHTESNITEP